MAAKFRFSIIFCRFFDSIKSEILSFCSGTGTLPADCSGWELLQYMRMLPLHSDLQRDKRPIACIDVQCACEAILSVDMSVLDCKEEDIKGNKDVVKQMKEFPSFALLKLRSPTDPGFKTELHNALFFSSAAVLTSRAFQDTINELPTVSFQIIGSDSTVLNMRAAIPCYDDFIGRNEEIEAIVKTVEAVAERASHGTMRAVLLHGNPGLGKSLLASQALRQAQKSIEQQEFKHDVLIEIIRGRGAAVAKDDFLAMGRSLGGPINVASGSPRDVVLIALKRFFKTTRYVLLIDDADHDGLSFVLQFLPVSTQSCTIIITSQSLTFDAVNLLVTQRGSASIQFHKELKLFTRIECMQLMRRICEYCDALLQNEDVLFAIFEDLGHLPLAIRLFAEWSRRQFNENMKPHSSDMELKMKAEIQIAKRVAKEAGRKFEDKDKKFAEAQFRVDYDAQTGYMTAAAQKLLRQWKREMQQSKSVLQADARYSRGLLGTVRLALLLLESLPSEMNCACKQLLGLLSLCPPAQVPWSLFDGGSKGEARFLVRGARVEVHGMSLEYEYNVPATGVEVLILEHENSMLKHRHALIKSHVLSSKINATDKRTVRLQLDEQELIVELKHVQFPNEVKVIDQELVLASRSLSVMVHSKTGRVFQHHSDQTVSVIFGCETGMRIICNITACTVCNTGQVK